MMADLVFEPGHLLGCRIVDGADHQVRAVREAAFAAQMIGGVWSEDRQGIHLSHRL